MQSGRGELGLTGQTTTELPLYANQNGAGRRVDEELRQRSALQPMGVFPREFHPGCRFARDGNPAGPVEYGWALIPYGKARALSRHLPVGEPALCRTR